MENSKEITGNISSNELPETDTSNRESENEAVIRIEINEKEKSISERGYVGEETLRNMRDESSKNDLEFLQVGIGPNKTKSTAGEDFIRASNNSDIAESCIRNKMNEQKGEKISGELLVRTAHDKIIPDALQSKGHSLKIGSNQNLDKIQSGTTSQKIVENKLFLKESFNDHPYKHLLTNFKPTKQQLSQLTSIQPPKSLHETPLLDIDKKDALEKLVKDLQEETELGVDVEWSDHGYKAVTCLVQISTKDKDIIIDAIALNDHMHLLNEVFTNTNIVKIFHAAVNDFKWLQEHFNLFVVNMFDTQRAMQALGYKKLGLAAALQENYYITKDRRMQRADFRKRPLPLRYKDYARADSHFLINLYHNLKNELIRANLLLQVLNECNNYCKIVYPKIADDSFALAGEDVRKMHQHQSFALEKLNCWRHRVAESVDRNTGIILSKKNMKALALATPTDRETIVRISKSEYVRQDLEEIVDIMREAKSLARNASFHRKFAPNKKRKLEKTDFGANYDVASKRRSGNSSRDHSGSR